MKIAILTKEFPPYIYGGAGVHVEHLVRCMEHLNAGEHALKVVCFGDQDETRPHLKITGVPFKPPFNSGDSGCRILLDVMVKNAAMIAQLKETDLIHCHTWYTHLAGCLLKQMLKSPLILTTHSLETQRPWKLDQLGNAYYASFWLEKTAFQNADGVIAVSAAMKRDVQANYGVAEEKIEVIPNGIDLTYYRHVQEPDILNSYGIDVTTPFILMVGRLTPQKGVIHFLEAIPHLMPGIQVVLCSSAPDTATYLKLVSKKVSQVRKQTENRIIWITEALPRKDLVALYSHADIFVCPSIYEPFGIINLEAMACGTPVVASAVGGITDVVSEGETGLLVSFEPIGPNNPEPNKPKIFAENLAGKINGLLADPELLESMGRLARKRVEAHYSWQVIAEKTLHFYEKFAKG